MADDSSFRKVLIAGYPKSGNTWLGYMISFLLGAQYVDLHQSKSKPTLVKTILELIGGHLPHSTHYKIVAKTHSLPQDVPDIESYDKIIHIIRDPRDVAVSFYFFRYRHLPIHLRHPLLLSLCSLKPSQLLLKTHMVFKVAREWPFHSLAWRTLHNAHFVRYEDLHKNPKMILEEIMHFLEIQREPELISQAVHHFEFEQVSGGRKQGEEDPYHFYRKGIIGDYKNHLNHFDLKIMGKIAGNQMRLFGYA